MAKAADSKVERLLTVAQVAELLGTTDRLLRMPAGDPSEGIAWRGTLTALLVGLAGFEPATSATQTRRASQTALQPVRARV
jgi:hypothetical protein